MTPSNPPSDRKSAPQGPPRRPGGEREGEPLRAVRLNRFLAECGVASRRRCDELIASGKVSVDGRTVTELGTRVDPEAQRVEVGGVVLEPRTRRHYYLLNKPRGVVCTNEGREARLRAIDLIDDPDKGRIFTVGRLDEDSEGLILLTDDGEFAQHVAHPRYGVEKTYLARVRGRVDGEALGKLQRGVHLAEGRTSGARLRVVKRTNAFTILELTLSEGVNREVRRMFAQVGYKVLRLRRTHIGSLWDPRLKEGRWRPLARAEVQELLSDAGRAKRALRRFGGRGGKGGLRRRPKNPREGSRGPRAYGRAGRSGDPRRRPRRGPRREERP